MARPHAIQIVRQRRVWLLLLLLGVSGCGGTGTISGVVKYKGKSLPTGKVVFFDAKNRQVATAAIGSDGTYKATVPTGSMRIAVITPSSSASFKSLPKEKAKVIVEGVKRMKKGAATPLDGGENEDLAPAKIISVPAKYASPDDSGLTLSVLGGPQSFDIDLQ